MTDEERGESGFASPLTFVVFLGIMFALLVIITQTTEWGEENQEMFFGDFIFKLILIPVFIAVFGWNGFFCIFSSGELASGGFCYRFP